ncbi:MAG: hypothetical protein R3F53_29350 [Gammaproteobacteria bacterium]
MLVALLIALLLPWLVGLLALRVLRLPPMLTAGAGFLLGMIGLSLLLRAWSGLDLPLQFMPVLLLLMLLALMLTPLAVKCRPAAPGAGTGASFTDLGAMARLAYTILLLLLIVRYAALAGEIAWRPLLGWDAWASWAVKAKVWFYQQHITPFVSSEAWLAWAGDSVYTVIANDYPATIPIADLVRAGLGRVAGNCGQYTLADQCAGAGTRVFTVTAGSRVPVHCSLCCLPTCCCHCHCSIRMLRWPVMLISG